MKLFNSRLATVAAAGLIVVLGGGTGAYASGLIDGGDIKNESITSADVDNGTIRSADIVNGENGVQSVDIKDGSVRLDDLAPGISDTILENMKGGGQVDANGEVTPIDPSDAVFERLAPENGPYLVALSVSGAKQAVQVTVDIVDSGDQVTCVAAPVAGFDGTCSAIGLTAGGEVRVTAPAGVTVELNATKG